MIDLRDGIYFYMKNFIKKLWRWVRWPFWITLGLGVVLFIVLIYMGRNKYLTDQAVAHIHAQRLTKEMVYAPLPDEPKPEENNATLAGIDANHNGIRDDVERAIYFAHQDSPRVVAAQYQYAMELQHELTIVFNSATWSAVSVDEDNGLSCIADVAFKAEGSTQDKISKSNAWIKEVESLVFNTDLRKKKKQQTKKYETVFVTTGHEGCDVDLLTFPD